MFELKVVTEFAAAHQLKMVAEKCENLHGHNWKVYALGNYGSRIVALAAGSDRRDSAGSDCCGRGSGA